MDSLRTLDRSALGSIVGWLFGRNKRLNGEVTQSGTDAIRIALAGTWDREAAYGYSVVVAEAGALSMRHRRAFISQASRLFDSRWPKRLNELAEMNRDSVSVAFSEEVGTLYKLASTPDFLLIGIEPRKDRVPTHHSYLRYDEYLRNRSRGALLVLVALSQCTFVESEAREHLIPIKRRQFAGWSDECLTDWLPYASRVLEAVSQVQALSRWDAEAQSASHGLLVESMSR